MKNTLRLALLVTALAVALLPTRSEACSLCASGGGGGASWTNDLVPWLAPFYVTGLVSMGAVDVILYQQLRTDRPSVALVALGVINASFNAAISASTLYLLGPDNFGTTLGVGAMAGLGVSVASIIWPLVTLYLPAKVPVPPVAQRVSAWVPPGGGGGVLFSTSW